MRRKLRVLKNSVRNALLKLLKLSGLIADMAIENRGYIRGLENRLRRLEEKYDNS